MTNPSISTASKIPEIGFMTIWQILGNKKANPPTPPIIPVSRTTWLDGVKSGIFPAPVKLGGRTNAWRVEDIRKCVSNLGTAQ
ncbi:MAG: helix-turn-helix transcriptional regulator [Methylococcaceae bacterium]